MGFQKGHKINIGNKNHLGFKHSEESRKKISQNNLGKVAWNKGKPWSEEMKRRISETNKRLGIEPRVKFVARGEEHWAWIEDRTKLSRVTKQGERRTSAYANWRKEVWMRDGYKCRIANGECDGRIEAHHILGFTKHPELRYEVNNGITLCKFHHPRKRTEEERLAPYFNSLVVEKFMPVPGWDEDKIKKLNK